MILFSIKDRKQSLIGLRQIALLSSSESLSTVKKCISGSYGSVKVVAHVHVLPSLPQITAHIDFKLDYLCVLVRCGEHQYQLKSGWDNILFFQVSLKCLECPQERP